MEKQQSVLITGTSTGIGLACALHLDSLGFKVFAGVRNKDDGSVFSDSPRIVPLILDVTKPEEIQSAVELISREKEFPLYGLINNAGIGMMSVLEAAPADKVRQTFEVNVIGMHSMIKAFLPLLRQTKGRVVNVSSIAGYIGGAGGGVYAASKFAVRGMTESLRLELMPLGMYASIIAPGAIESAIWEKDRQEILKLRKEIDPEVLAAYEMFIKAGDNMRELVHPIPAIFVAKAVAQALTSKKPKLLYLVGKDARFGYKLSRLPRSLFENLVMQGFKKWSEMK